MTDWRECQLGDLGVVVGGGTPPRERAEYWNGSIPWLTPGELTWHSDKFVFETQDCISELGLASSGARLLSEGSLLVTSRASIGSCALAGRAMATNQGFKNVTPGTEVDPSFLFYLGRTLAKEMTRRASGTTFLEISGREFERIKVRLPPLEEQRRIAEILDTIDEAIRATERVIAKLIDVEQGLRRDLLDRKLQRARSEDWKHCRIGDFAEVQRGASPRPIDNPAWFAPDGPGWIRISDVTAAGDLLLRTRDHLSPAGVARSRRTFPGDVIMSIAATIGVAIVVGIEACYHDGFVRIDHDGSVIPEFLVMLLAHHKEDFVRSGQTGTQANINSTIVAATEVALPGLEVQLEIVSVTSAVRGSIRVEKESRRALQETRAGLASDLLSGRVRTVAA